MATILELVETLIGDVLAGNVYSNASTYRDLINSVSTRAGIYQYGNPPLQISQQAYNLENGIIPPPQGPIENMSRDKIYNNSNSLNRKGPAPTNIEGQNNIVSQDASFTKGQSFNPDTRNDIYAITERNRQVVSNIAGTPDSNPTLGDIKAAQGMPPAASLKFKGPSYGDVPSEADLLPRPLIQPSREQIYKDIDSAGVSRSPNGIPPAPPLSFQGPRYGDIPQPESSLYPRPLTQPSREDVYKNYDSAGIPLLPDGRPPTPSLSQVTPESSRRDFAALQGQIGREFSEAHRLGNVYDDDDVKLLAARGGPFRAPAFVGPLRHFDIFAISHWFRNIGKEFGLFPIQDNNDQNKVQRPAEMIAKGVTWLASQFLLASMNPGDVQGHGPGNLIWNPLSLPLSLIPGTRVASSISNITVGSVLTDYKTNLQISVATGTERLLLMRQGAYSEVAPVHRLSQGRSPIATPGFFGDLSKAGEQDTIQQGKLPFGNATVSAQVDGGVDALLASKLGLHTNVYSSERPYSTENAVKPLRDLETSETAQIDKLKALFSPKAFPGSPTTSFGPTAYTFVNKTNASSFTSLIDSPAARDANIVDAGYLEESEEDSLVEENPLGENQTYMPFMFEDLRDKPAKFLYFRAFLKEGLTETFTPDWEIDNYYGRVDAIPIYKNTLRTISVAFDVVAFKPADLLIIYKKLEKLQSMIYPTYDMQGFMKAGPILRMRIGDLIAGENNRGLPGYITALDLAYDDGIWNIEENLKVPRKISVSLGYTVVHDGNPGTYPYEQASINDDGSVDSGGEPRFGAAKFFRHQGGSDVFVSRANIRKIFNNVRNRGGSS